MWNKSWKCPKPIDEYQCGDVVQETTSVVYNQSIVLELIILVRGYNLVEKKLEVLHKLSWHGTLKLNRILG